MKTTENYLSAVKMLPPFKNFLMQVPDTVKERAIEIRIRVGRPIIVETPEERFICNNTKATSEGIYECIKHFCDYSLYSFENEIARGFITLKGGHRAGFSGSAVIRDEKVHTIKDISSINIRISCQHTGCAERLFSLTAFQQDFRGLLIIGPPLSAKTTLLRDYCRLVSAFKKAVLIDDRGEISASFRGVPQNDIGLNCDVLCGFCKSEAITIAVKTLSPEYIFCDEVTGEYNELSECSGLGVKSVITMHCGGITDLGINNGARELIASRVVNYICSLEKGRRIGKIGGLWRVDDAEAFDCLDDSNNLYIGRNNTLLPI